MASFEGTLLLNVYLRLMGVKIGKRVLLADGYSHFVDHDMIKIGDYATVGAMYQAHTFEDRMLKIGHIRLGAYSTLGNNTVPLYLSDVGEHTFVAPASVIMKGEVLPSWTSWNGNPAMLSDEAMVLSDSFVEESSKLGSLSPLKNETLLPWMRYEGVPTQRQHEDCSPPVHSTIHSQKSEGVSTRKQQEDAQHDNERQTPASTVEA
jgi:carbonic anhydrase/acetyltransferase-like protein (isoleucine patch superfamily)